MGNDCLFCKMVAGEIPTNSIYDDHEFMAFLDIRPTAKGHALVIPKEHCENLMDMPPGFGEGFIRSAQKVAGAIMKTTGAEGFNIGLNNGAVAGQEIFHAHFHIIPRYAEDDLKLWEGKSPEEHDLQSLAEQIRENLD